MSNQLIISTARALIAGNKGLLAMDESNPTCDKRFKAIGVSPTAEMRRVYREMLVTTPRLNESISGAILFDETIHQTDKAGTLLIQHLMNADIIPGIKVDAGTKDLAAHPGEKVTEGLDGLRQRLENYAKLGLRFAKWRSVIAIGPGMPSRGCIEANMHALARYAALCQEAGLVPIVEPEVLLDGDHSMEQCFTESEKTLRVLFDQLDAQRVELRGLILKASMVLPGKDCPQQNDCDEVAEATIHCLQNTVPAAVPGVAFLSGGQTYEAASARLNAMNRVFKTKVPWALTFSFARAIQGPALTAWKGDDRNRDKVQKILAYRALCNHAACDGRYGADMEDKMNILENL